MATSLGHKAQYGDTDRRPNKASAKVSRAGHRRGARSSSRGYPSQAGHEPAAQTGSWKVKAEGRKAASEGSSVRADAEVVEARRRRGAVGKAQSAWHKR